MDLVELTRRRPAAVTNAQPMPSRTIGNRQQQSRGEVAAEVGRTMLILILIALGIVALRFILAAAYGFLH
jgi:hypothetical protein